jgi:integrase
MKSNAIKFPITVNHSRIKTLSAKIYSADNGGRPEYTLVYYNANGERKRIASRDLPALEVRAEEVLNDIATARPPEENALTASQREECVNLKAIFSEVSIAPLIGARHYVEAVKILGADLVIEAAREYHTRHCGGLEKKTIADAVSDFVAAKRNAGKSSRYISDLAHRLGRFSGFMPNKEVGDVTAADLQRFFDGLKLGAQSHNNFLRVLNSFFEHCKRRRCVRKDWDEIAAIDAMKRKASDVEIYTPDEIKKLIDCTKNGYRLFILLGAFAGLRSAEISRLDWSAINFTTGFIELKAGNTKTGSRRLIPIAPNLYEWLKGYYKSSGLVCPSYTGSFYRDLGSAVEKAGAKWKANALRHSFISYRLAETQSANQVALEAGNSPAMIFKHYRELVTPAQAKQYFAVTPVTPENVVRLASAAA